jgi:hypothetical protein
MIITSDKPWRRHHRTAWRWVVAAVVLAALITAVRWCWYWALSWPVSPPKLTGKIVAVEAAGYMKWSSEPSSQGIFTTLRFEPLHALSADASSVSQANKSLDSSTSLDDWYSMRDLPHFHFSIAPLPSQSIRDLLQIDRGLLDPHLDPPLAQSPRGRWNGTGIVFLARLDNGSAVWVFEIARRIGRGYPVLYFRNHRQFLVFDEGLGQVLGTRGWYKYTWEMSVLSTVAMFFVSLVIMFLVVATPIALSIRRGFITRRRFLARRCIACDYNFAGHGEGLLTCPECGQVQWPVDGVVPKS